jgi:hypothetical protein
MEAPMNPDHDSHTVRRIVLPSGRAIEVVRFGELDEQPVRELHRCPMCDSLLVQPLSWVDAGEERWELELECPNCWWNETGTYEREEIEALEDRLDSGLAEMLGDLQRLTEANMIEELDRFARALACDAILPEDF